jgi:hypothetical protein
MVYIYPTVLQFKFSALLIRLKSGPLQTVQLAQYLYQHNKLSEFQATKRRYKKIFHCNIYRFGISPFLKIIKIIP